MTEVIIHINGENFREDFLSKVDKVWQHQNLKPTWVKTESELKFSEIEEKLYSGQYRIAAIPLPKVPIENNSEIIIGALSPRMECSYQLIIKNDVYDIMSDLRIKSKSRIFVLTEKESLQLNQLNSNILIEIITKEQLNKIENKTSVFDALLLAQNYNFENEELSGYQNIKLHVSEVVPEAGAGVMAFICHKEDLNSRRILKSIHQKDVAACTNVERLSEIKTQALLKFPLSVHIELTHHGHYNAYVFGILKNGATVKLNRTQSTSAGLVEYIYTKIEQEFLKI